MNSLTNTIALADKAPSEDTLTAYDEAHFRLYMDLLNAEASKVPRDRICREFLDIDSAREPGRAQRRLESHLSRARWFATGDGFRHLVNRGQNDDTPHPYSQESSVR